MTSWHELAIALGVKGAVSGAEYRAHCPLHNDARPSFSMNIATGRWVCHAGCGQGEFYRLVELILGCSQQAAREWIKDNGKQLAIENISRQLLETIMAAESAPGPGPAVSKNWLPYYESLTAKTMPLWFLERGFTWETIQHWGIRYDSVQDAIAIPVRKDGSMIGVITRNHVRTPKYQNSDGLKKSDLLFTEIKPNSNLLILVEGVLDAIWLWQLGYNAASLLGHDLSHNQTAIIQRQRYAEVCLALDNDDAGRAGTTAAVKQLQKAGYLLPQLSYLKYPPNRKDAQDCTPEELETAFNQRKENTLELFSLV